MLNKGEEIHDLPAPGYRLIQDRAHFRYGTDAVLLADFCRRDKARPQRTSARARARCPSCFWPARRRRASTRSSSSRACAIWRGAAHSSTACPRAWPYTKRTCAVWTASSKPGRTAAWSATRLTVPRARAGLAPIPPAARPCSRPSAHSQTRSPPACACCAAAAACTCAIARPACATSRPARREYGGELKRIRFVHPVRGQTRVASAGRDL